MTCKEFAALPRSQQIERFNAYKKAASCSNS